MVRKNAYGPLAELAAVTATEAKNAFGAVLDKVAIEGPVAITKHAEVRAVLVSAREYEALTSPERDTLVVLSQEFDGLVERMQTPAARKAGRILFEATPAQLGQSARARARRRRG